MIQIFFSELARKYYRISIEPIPSEYPKPSHSYRIDLFQSEVEQLVLLTNQATLSTRIFSSSIRLSDLLSFITEPASNVTFHKGGDRHVVGSMNDMKRMIGIMSELEPQRSVADHERMINDCPFKFIGYKSPNQLQNIVKRSS